MAKTLADLRIQIDALDQELLALLNRRAGLANEVGEIKSVEGSAVFRPERETQVIHNLQQSNPGPLKPEGVAFIWREIMSACRALEAAQRVAYLGPAGTFSEMAAFQFFGSSIEQLPCASIDEVFRATAAGSAEFGVVPVENSTEGMVSRSLDLFLTSPLQIVGETSLRVRHNLLRHDTYVACNEVVKGPPPGCVRQSSFQDVRIWCGGRHGFRQTGPPAWRRDQRVQLVHVVRTAGFAGHRGVGQYRGRAHGCHCRCHHALGAGAPGAVTTAGAKRSPAGGWRP